MDEDTHTLTHTACEIVRMKTQTNETTYDTNKKKLDTSKGLFSCGNEN